MYIKCCYSNNDKIAGFLMQKSALLFLTSPFACVCLPVYSFIHHFGRRVCLSCCNIFPNRGHYENLGVVYLYILQLNPCCSYLDEHSSFSSLCHGRE